MINIVNGNIVFAKEDIIGHQVNCKGVMGSGVAYQLRNEYPAIFPPYQQYCRTLGNELLGKVQLITVSSGKYILNMFGQDGYGRDKQYTNIAALEECIAKLYTYATENGLTVALPYGIGCGRGGADWNIVYSILCKYFGESDGSTQLVLYKYKG